MPLSLEIDYVEIFKLIKEQNWSVYLTVFGIVSYISNKYLLPIVKPIYEAKIAESNAKKKEAEAKILDYKNLEDQIIKIRKQCDQDKATITKELTFIKGKENVIINYVSGFDVYLETLGITISDKLEERIDKYIKENADFSAENRTDSG